MSDMNDYLWLVKTEHGNFFVTVLGEWTMVEAERKLRLVFESIHIEIKEIVPRKRATGSLDMSATIYEATGQPLGFEFLAGLGIWKACGRATEYRRVRKAALQSERK